MGVECDSFKIQNSTFKIISTFPEFSSLASKFLMKDPFRWLCRTMQCPYSSRPFSGSSCRSYTRQKHFVYQMSAPGPNNRLLHYIFWRNSMIQQLYSKYSYRLVCV